MNREKILIIKYKYDLNKEEKDRRNALYKAIVTMGPLDVYKIIKKMYNSKQQEDDTVISKLKDDKKWIKKNCLSSSYSNIDKKSKKKSRKKSRRKSRQNKSRRKSKK